jgi:hypothetical protein
MDDKDYTMYELKCGEDVFVVDSWSEVREMWEEIVMALGAEDAEMSVRFVSETE